MRQSHVYQNQSESEVPWEELSTVPRRAKVTWEIRKDLHERLRRFDDLDTMRASPNFSVHTTNVFIDEFTIAISQQAAFTSWCDERCFIPFEVQPPVRLV